MSPKQILIPFAAAFGLSLGVGTGIVMVRTPKPAPAAAVARKARDSTRVAPVATVAAQDTAPKVDSASMGHAPMGAPHDSTPSPAAHVATATPAAPAASTTPSTKLSAAKPTARAPKDSAASAPPKSAPGAVARSVPAIPHTPPTPARDTLVGQRLAKVFGAMQARDAARVLEQMDDSDVRTILALLSSKQQAAILGTFPAQRAATLMRATLRTSPGANQ